MSARHHRVSNSSYYWGGLRRLGAQCGGAFVEVTCLPSEVPECAAWLEQGASGELPVDEFTRRPWRKNYRWSAAANAVYRRAIGSAA
jgi:hypothetical protein